MSPGELCVLRGPWTPCSLKDWNALGMVLSSLSMVARFRICGFELGVQDVTLSSKTRPKSSGFKFTGSVHIEVDLHGLVCGCPLKQTILRSEPYKKFAYPWEFRISQNPPSWILLDGVGHLAGGPANTPVSFCEHTGLYIICKFTSTCTKTYRHTHTPVYIHALCADVCTHTFWAYAYAYIHMYIYSCMHMYKYTHVYITRIYVYVYAPVYTQRER